jgi:Family of unknown function (DUF6588)
MKPRTGWLAGFVLLILLAAATPSWAQLEENLQGLSDDNAQGYLGPLNTALSGTMNSAIFHTGKVHKEGFHFTIGMAAMAVGFDTEDETYLPTDPEGFTSLEETEVPTVVGDPNGQVVAGENSLTQLYPGGLDLSGFEIAVPQLTIGNVMGTCAVIRYIALDLGDSELGEFSYMGYGLQHSISQWLTNPPFDIAAGIFFQSFSIGEDDLIDSSAMTFNVTASKQYNLLRPYVGLGYDSMKTDVYSKDEEDPDNTLDTSLEDETNTHLTLGVAAVTSAVSIYFEFNAAAANGFALGFEFGN